MSDVNVIITAVDKGIDIIDGYEREVEDLHTHVFLDIYSVITSVEREKVFVEQELDELCYSTSEDVDDSFIDKADILYRQRELLDSLLYQSNVRGKELESEWNDLCTQTIDLAEESKRTMGVYIRNLNRINYSNGTANFSGSGHGPEYYVVIVDSQKYPQTAAHISIAQTMGFPEFVTLDRSSAAERRKAALAEVKVSSIYDRDEWPMAVFKEGGYGSHVAYIEGHDNKGAGSSIGWQMRGFPDGSRVRVRVI